MTLYKLYIPYVSTGYDVSYVEAENADEAIEEAIDAGPRGITDPQEPTTREWDWLDIEAEEEE